MQIHQLVSLEEQIQARREHPWQGWPHTIATSSSSRLAPSSNDCMCLLYQSEKLHHPEKQQPNGAPWCPPPVEYLAISPPSHPFMSARRLCNRVAIRSVSLITFAVANACSQAVAM